MSPAQILDLFRSVVAFVLPFIPHDELAKVLSDEAVKRQNAIANTAEAAKFGGV